MGIRDQQSLDETIAIVGVGCRLPGSISSLSQLWSALSAGNDLVSENPPAERFDATRLLDPSGRPGTSYTFAGGYLDDITGFDAGFFGLSPREAGKVDPQQRLVLELAVEALDDAALDPALLAGTNTGVFIGVSSRGYWDAQWSAPGSINAYSMTGTASGNTANRLSHFLDLKGPSMAVDTACSSALVAIHQARGSLLRREIDIAVTGGVNVLLNPYEYVGFSQASMLSPTGRCHTFSAAADGYVRAEGAGIFVFKRLPDALADNDRVHALIATTGVNSDGRTAGLALPSGEAQESLLREVYRNSGISSGQLVYFEAHGTGTPAGDPIECGAVGRAIATHRDRDNPLPIGSVKTNVGHLESASGAAGLLKAALVLRHREIPPSLHGAPANPEIDFADIGLCTVPSTMPVRASGTAAVGVNSFGFGGTNAHVVLIEPPASAAASGSSPGVNENEPLPVLVSAATGEGLREAASRMASRLSWPETDFHDLAYTACVRRARHQHRAAVLACDPAGASERLAEIAATGAADDWAVAGAADAGVVFAFSGNGSQWAGMGAELLTEDHVFRAVVEEADAVLRPRLGWSIVAYLARPCGHAEIARTEIAQPLLFAVQLGIAASLAARGIRPAAVVGHSVGEIAAAAVSQALDLDTAAEVLVARSRAQAATAGVGRMAAVALGQDEAARELNRYHGRLALAAVNSDHDVTVSGDREAIQEFGKELAARDVFVRELDLDYAFHSHIMDPVEPDLRAALKAVRSRAPEVPFVSTVTGDAVSGDELTADYWWRNIREPVLFGPTVQRLADQFDIFLEIGPRPVLGTYLRRQTRSSSRPVFISGTLDRGVSGWAAMRTAVERLMAAGAAVDWRTYFPRQGRVVDLPAYPWQRDRHWTASPHGWHRSSGDGDSGHPLLGERAAVHEPTWTCLIAPHRQPWLGDHRVGDAVVMPAACYVEQALAAGRLALGAPVRLDHVDISKALVLPWKSEVPDVTLQVSVSDEDGIVRIASRAEGVPEWRQHARCRVRRARDHEPEPMDLTVALGRRPGRQDRIAHYERATRAGLHYGPAFQVVDESSTTGDVSVARYTAGQLDDRYQVLPSVLDGALQACLPLLPDSAAGTAYVPATIESVRAWRSPSATGFVHVRRLAHSAREVHADITITDDAGHVAVRLARCVLRRFDTGDQTPVQRYTTVLRAAPRHVDRVVPFSSPTPAEIASLSIPDRERILAQWRGQGYERFIPRFKSLVAHFVAGAILELVPGQSEFTLAHLAAAGLLPKYTKLALLLLDLAADHGLLSKIDERWWRLASPDPDPEPLYQSLADEFPNYALGLALYGRCGRQLAGVLRGAVDPLQMLFADGERHFIENYYAQSPELALLNQLAAAATRSIVASRPADRPLRVLEVGAGTGGVTAALLPVLSPERTWYVFTDLSAAFFPRARDRFRAYEFVQYTTLDLERDPGEQGFADGEFDLVVAANVLHATTNLAGTLDRVRSLLTDGGYLLAVEAHDPQTIALCFGMLDGFWSFTDGDLRTHSPLLPVEEWEPVLRDRGFEDVVQFGDDLEPARSDCSVILARSSRSPAASGTASLVSRGAAWSIVAEPGVASLAAALSEILTGAGNAPVHVFASTEVHRNGFDVPEGTRAAGVALLLEPADPADGDEASQVTTRRAAVIREITRACSQADDRVEIDFWLATAPHLGLPVAGVIPAAPAGVTEAAAWAVARVVANELPRIRVRRIMSERTGDDGTDAWRIAREFLDADDEDEIVLARGGRFASSVTVLAPPSGHHRDFALRVQDPGLRYRLEWAEDVAPAPKPDDVVITVRAAALNYRDIMLATGLLPPTDGTGHLAGLECAGVVESVGAAVTEFEPGDAVFAMTPHHTAFASRVVAPAGLVGRIPDGVGFEAAATIPVAWLTVHYGLGTLGRLAAGDILLVHGAAGGVGQAAIRYARHVGADVIATAGSETKRDLLRALGVTHVLDSRGLEFADEVMALTGGRGVDVVLNTLSGEAIARSLEVLASGGRFVELGKRDYVANSRLLMRPLLNNLSFLSAHVDQLIAQRPDIAYEQFREIARHAACGRYRPLPYAVYPAREVHEAFRVLRHSRHIGKVVVSLDEPPLATARDAAPLIDPAATYLITGGLSGFGAATARWLASRGARHLTLVSRSGLSAPEAPGLIDDLRALGVDVDARAADVTDQVAIGAMFAQISRAGRPLKGIVHAAMRLVDAPLADLSDADFSASVDPKLAGGMALDSLTREHRHALDFFVVYSSATALVGNAGQANYAAGNLALEALVRSRLQAGLAGVAVGWGAIGETGYVTRNNLTAAMTRLGLGSLAQYDALSELDSLLTGGVDAVAVGRFDWTRFAAMLPAINVARFARVLPDSGRHGDAGSDELSRDLADAPDDEAITRITEVLVVEIAGVLQADPSQVDRRRRLDQIGLDSLMAAELAAAIRARLRCDIAAVEVTDCVGIDELASRVRTRLVSATPRNGKGDQQ